MNVAVIGSRNFRDREQVERWFGENWTDTMHLLSGGARGVDSWAEELAAMNGDEPTILKPDYHTYPASRYGSDFAPKMRNKAIVDGAERVVAFWDGRSTGTAHAIAWAAYRGKKLVIRLSSVKE